MFEENTYKPNYYNLLLYLAAAEDVSREIDLMVWWKSHEAELPNWARVLSTYNFCNYSVW